MSTTWLRPLLFTVLMVSGCVLEPVDLSGFPCPCSDGYECELTSNRCLPVDEGDGVVLVRNLSAGWTTPSWIHWTWEPEAPDDHQLARYELTVAESIDDLLASSGTARRFDPDTNPELARYTLPRSGSAEVIDATFSSGHQPDTEYVARLLAIDTAGRTRWSNIARARTSLAPVAERVIVDEAEDPPDLFLRCGRLRCLPT